MSTVRLGRPSGRNIIGGLPASPRARSVGRYDARERETEAYKDRTRDNDYPQRSIPTLTRPVPTRAVRPQRSVANILPPRAGPSTSYSDVPAVPPLPLPRRSDESYKSDASSRSYASASGSSSTFLDRIKGRGGYGYGSSSQTSVEEVEGQSREEMARDRATGMPEDEYGETRDGDDDEFPEQPGYGLSLWSRVATAANTLTISVSKAWASNIAGHSGEQTPPGEESRLTRALKAYHIEKARNPGDLPEWLFEEHERRPLGRSGARSRHQEGSEYGERETHLAAAAPARPSGRGLRDVFDAAAAATAIAPRQQEARGSSRGRPKDDAPAAPPSKANDRLKALRDAKRSAARRNAAALSVRFDTPSDADARPVREERRRDYGQERGRGEGPYPRSPSLPAGVRPPPRGGGLPPRPGMRKV
ncbi:hypothetical protein BC826DRAFT_988199 [Russula brevipes]|nr:hypothetical protein BC826DRAFT_988199 [Russula brevipes]